MRIVIRGSWRGKMGIGIGRFCPGKMGFKPLGLGFGHWEWEKMLKINNGNGIWELRSGKLDLEKNELGNAIGTHPSGTSDTIGKMKTRVGIKRILGRKRRIEVKKRS